MNYRELKLYQNIYEENSSMGSFIIGKFGNMMPRTRNTTIWGVTSSSYIPRSIRKLPNVVTSVKGELAKYPEVQLSAFYKFSKTDYGVAIESIGREIATHFNTKTCFNCPVHIDKSQNSLFHYNNEIHPEEDRQIGTLVYSFLGKNERLYTFAKIMGTECGENTFASYCNAISHFVSSTIPDNKQMQDVLCYNLSKEFAYQYLLRDYIGDVDFTSRNCGLVLNEETKEITLAPGFDYGEAFNILTSSKFAQPKMVTRSFYPDEVQETIPQEQIDELNEISLHKYYASPTELANKNTFGSTTERNLSLITRLYPDVALDFLIDMKTFAQNGTLEKIVNNYSGENNLLTPQQGEQIKEFMDARTLFFGRELANELGQVIDNNPQGFSEDKVTEIEEMK